MTTNPLATAMRFCDDGGELPCSPQGELFRQSRAISVWEARDHDFTSQTGEKRDYHPLRRRPTLNAASAWHPKLRHGLGVMNER
jgi:hypothetical protein